MKRISQEEKLFFIRRAARNHKHELKRKRRRKKLRYLKCQQKIKENRAIRFYSNPKSVRHSSHVASQDFSILADPEKVISYFAETKKSFDKGDPVVLDLSAITSMDPATLTYLCAVVNDKKFTKGTPLRGNLPRVPELREMFIQSGFQKFVSFKLPKASGGDKYGELIHETEVKVEPRVASHVCLSAMKHTLGTDQVKSSEIYKILIECMANTHNHANFNDTRNVYNWWLLAYKDSKTKVTKFCFLDIGIGIFGSLHGKFIKRLLPTSLIKIFVPDHDDQTLIKIFQGETKTTAKQKGRGKGVKNIYDLVKHSSNIKNFTLISNDIKARIGYNAPDVVQVLKSNFRGTLYYWELIPSEN
jgi:hypothetical protein